MNYSSSSTPKELEGPERRMNSILMLHVNLDYSKTPPTQRHKDPSGFVRNACVDALATALEELIVEPDITTFLIQKCSSFSNEIVSWILTFDDKERLLAMKKNLLVCRCLLHDKNVNYHFHKHQTRRMTIEEGEARFQSFVTGLFYLLVSFVGCVSHHSISKILRFPPNKDGPWKDKTKGAGTYALSHFLGYNTAIWLKASFLWFELARDPLIPTFIYFAIQYTHHHARPVLVKIILSFPHFPSLLVDVLNAHFNSFLSSTTSAMALNSTPLPLTKADRATFQHFQHISLFVTFLYRSREKLPGYFECHAAHLFTSIHDLVHASTALSGTASEEISAALDSFMPQLVWLGLELYNLVQDQDAEKERMHEFLSRQTMQAPDAGPGYLKLWSDIHNLRESSFCLNPPCLLRKLETIGTLRCANCQVYKYCSKECQREAWRYPDHPHRDYCKGLHALRKVWLWDTDDDIMKKSYREDETVKLVGQTAIEAKLGKLAEEAGVSEEDVDKLMHMFDLYSL